MLVVLVHFKLKKLIDNAYVIDLSQDFDISSTFNIEDIVDYNGPDFNPNNPLDKPSHESISERHSLQPLLNILLDIVNQSEKIVDDEIITTGTRKYLV